MTRIRPRSRRQSPRSLAAASRSDPRPKPRERRARPAADRRRWLIGSADRGVLVVVFTVRQPANVYRLISARPANRRERRRYEEARRFDRSASHEVRAGLDPPTAIGERSPLLARSQRPTGLDNPRVPSSPALAAVHSSRGSGGMPRMDDELHIAVEEVEEADKLAETLPSVGRIEQPI